MIQASLFLKMPSEIHIYSESAISVIDRYIGVAVQDVVMDVHTVSFFYIFRKLRKLFNIKFGG